MAIQERYGEFSIAVIGDQGIPPSQVPAISGGGIAQDTVVMFFTCELGEDYANDPNITIQMFPSGKFTQGCDQNGSIAVTCTWSQNPVDKNLWGHTGSSLPNPVDFSSTGGFFATPFRCVVNVNPEEVTAPVEFYMQIGGGDLSTYTEDPTRETPTDPTTEEVSWDEEIEQGEVTLQFTYQQPATEEEAPDGFAVLIAEDVDGTPPPFEDFFEWGNVPNDVPNLNEIDTFEFLDWAYTPPGVPQSWWYIIVAYWVDDLEYSTPTTPTLVEWTDDLPDIDWVMGIDNPGTGGIDFGGAATVVALGNPAGLYTLEPNAHVDTIYDRITTEETTEVAIPRPFLKTGFIP